MNHGMLGMIAIVLVTRATGASDVDMGNSHTRNPEMVAQVLAGKITTADAAWWGFDPEDATDCLQQAITSGAKKVIVPFMGSDWIVRPIKLAGNQEITFEPGVVVMAKKGSFKGKSDSLFTADKQRNITLTGYGATFRMRKSEYVLPDYQKAEWRMTLEIDSCENVTVTGLTLADSGGDGIYVGDSDPKHACCKNVLIQDVTFDNHYRQGLSVISADGITVENCLFKNTSGTPPAAGIDFEPNLPTEQLTNCHVRNCIFEGNQGAGVMAYVGMLSADSKPLSIDVSDCLVRNNTGPGLWFGGIADPGVKGLVEFTRCTIVDDQQQGVFIADKSPEGAIVRFVGCSWKNVAAASPATAPISINAIGNLTLKRWGGVEFVDCNLYDDIDRPVISISSSIVDVSDVKGLIHLHRPPGDAELVPKAIGPGIRVESEK